MKIRPLFPVFLILVLCAGFFASCGKENEPTTEPTITVVSYMLTHIDSGAFSYSADEFRTTGSLDIRSDGTATLFYADQTDQLLYDDSNMWSADDTKTLHSYRQNGKVLVLDYFGDTLTFLETGASVVTVK